MVKLETAIVRTPEYSILESFFFDGRKEVDNLEP